MSGDEARKIVENARSEARRMLEATDRLADEVNVEIPLPSFRALALLLEQMATIADAPTRSDEFDRPIDGFQFWVPMAIHHAVRQELSDLQKRIDQANFESQFHQLISGVKSPCAPLISARPR